MLKDIQLIAIKILKDDPDLSLEKNKLLKNAVDNKFLMGVEM